MKKSLDVHRLNLHLGANQKIHAIARSLRQNSTDAEQVLWNELRNRNLEDINFDVNMPFCNPLLTFIVMKQNW